MKVIEQFTRRFHRDDRGAIGILLLLTMMSLVALLAMVWNEAEYAFRRRHVQMAADAAAQSTTLWMGRTNNLVAATNEVICENASAEVILRSTQQIVQVINSRLQSDYQRIQRMLQRIQQQQERNNNNPRGADPNLALKLELEQRTLQTILNIMQDEISAFQDIADRTRPAFGVMSADELASRRDSVIDYQQQIMDLTPAAIQEQRISMSDYYKCDLTVGRPGGETVLEAPVKTVDHTNVEGVYVAGASVSDGSQNVWVSGGYWGEILCPPLRRFFNDRVNRDIGNGRASSLIPLLQAFDNARAEIDTYIRQTLDPSQLPPNATQDTIRAYTDAQRDLLNMRLGDKFALSTYYNILNGWRSTILARMGDGTQHVLSTYDRYPVPDWAKSSVYQDAYQYVYNWVYSHNYQRLWNMKYQQLRGQGRRNPNYNDGAARRQATAWAQQVTRDGAEQIATEAATIWINRTWPYEITPPQQQSLRGISKDDRFHYFTIVAMARSTDETDPRPALAKLLRPTTGGGSTQDQTATPRIVMFAQGEAFNWMEYNGGYGASDSYTTRTPPSPWRVSTNGGWTWQPRLAFSDALGTAISNNPEMQQFFGSAGIDPPDSAAIDKMVMH